MNSSFDRSIDSKPALNWRVLGLLNLYRVLTPLVLLALYPLGGARGFAIDSRQLFFGANAAYLCFGIGSIILVRRRLASAYVQTILQATVDLTLLLLLLHACGGTPAASACCCSSRRRPGSTPRRHCLCICIASASSPTAASSSSVAYEVLRGKALDIIAQHTKVTDETGNEVDLQPRAEPRRDRKGRRGWRQRR